ncbi:bifunctional diguanylate cyclase/phosphodiesterase [Shewanella litorisediminis]|nr:bifunctional diguanylate cyclase/phosphodiesterase [Shewanella litorisediminis]
MNSRSHSNHQAALESVSPMLEWFVDHTRLGAGLWDCRGVCLWHQGTDDEPIATLTLRGIAGDLKLCLHGKALSAPHETLARALLEGVAAVLGAGESGLLQSFMDAFEEHIWIKDAEGRYRFINQSTLVSWDITRAQILSYKDAEIFPERFAEYTDTDHKAVKEGHPIVVAECIDRSLDKGNIWLETIKAPMYDTDGRLLGVIGTTRDIARYKAAEEQLLLTSKVFENAIEGVMITDSNGVITEINGAFETITGYSRDEVIGKTPKLLNSGRHEPDFFENLWRALKTQGHWHGEIWNRRKNGTLFAEQTSISAVYGEDGQIRCFVAVFSDISLLKQTEAEVAQLAWHDPLTRLPNRSKLNTITQQQIKLAANHKTRLALLLIDVDLFKHINDSFGHLAGDKVLLLLSERLSALLGAEDTLARIGGDEFVLLTQVRRRDDIPVILSAIQRAFDTSFDTSQGESVRLSASIGIAVYPDDGDNPDTLLKNADAAMYRAKQQGRNRHAFYTEQMTQSSMHQLRLQTALRGAVKNGALSLVYQPKINLRTRKLIGVEALCRWTDHELGVISPAEFIPVAESIGLMPEIGLWVLKEACRQARIWRDQGLNPGRMAVNVSGSQLTGDNFADSVARVLKQTGLSPEALELEITESVVLDNPAGAIDILEKIRGMGVSLALDDFGTGYSSLSYLRKLPLNKLKIDQSFVRELPADQDSGAIAMAIIAMGDALKLGVIAEGVENEAQAEFLLRLGCIEAQGYLFARPLLASELKQLLLGE